MTTLGAGTPALIQGKYTCFPGTVAAPGRQNLLRAISAERSWRKGGLIKGGGGAAKGGPALLSREQNQVGCQQGAPRDLQNDARARGASKCLLLGRGNQQAAQGP